MENSNTIFLETVKVRLSLLEKLGISMDEWVHDLLSKVDGLSETQCDQLVDILKKDLARSSKQVQILGGSQNIGQQQFIFQEESISKLGATIAALATTINEQYGSEVGAEIMKTAIMAIANSLSK